MFSRRGRRGRPCLLCARAALSFRMRVCSLCCTTLHDGCFSVSFAFAPHLPFVYPAFGQMLNKVALCRLRRRGERRWSCESVQQKGSAWQALLVVRPLRRICHLFTFGRMLSFVALCGLRRRGERRWSCEAVPQQGWAWQALLVVCPFCAEFLQVYVFPFPSGFCAASATCLSHAWPDVGFCGLVRFAAQRGEGVGKAGLACCAPALR